MGFRFHKSIRLLPGVKLNITKRGVSSVSVGKPGLTANVGPRGVRGTLSLIGTGLSFFKLFKWK